ncbi:hypothetical protein SESBI_13356 [Sesbania bispinosa]|nr:hypothetical protein SESBI_13356 [Sesbania bispinosa]
MWGILHRDAAVFHSVPCHRFPSLSFSIAVSKKVSILGDTHFTSCSRNGGFDGFSSDLSREDIDDRIQELEKLELLNKPSPVRVIEESSSEDEMEQERPSKEEALAPFLKFFKGSDEEVEEEGEVLEVSGEKDDVGDENGEETEKVNVEYYEPKPLASCFIDEWLKWKLRLALSSSFIMVSGQEVVIQGDGVLDLKPGDHVLPVFTGECGECPHCKSEESICCVVKINPTAPLDKVCILSCGITTGLGGCKAKELKKGASIAVFGLGTVGLAAVEGARIAEASKIIGVDLNHNRYKEANQSPD